MLSFLPPLEFIEQFFVTQFFSVLVYYTTMMYVPTKYFTIVFMGGALSQTRKDEGYYFHLLSLLLMWY